jgi:hypothetical protein
VLLTFDAVANSIAVKEAKSGRFAEVAVADGGRGAGALCRLRHGAAVGDDVGQSRRILDDDFRDDGDKTTDGDDKGEHFKSVGTEHIFISCKVIVRCSKYDRATVV